MTGKKLFWIIFGAIVCAQLFVAIVSGGITLLFAKGIINVDETRPNQINPNPTFQSPQVNPDGSATK
jgi:hypothetical protein